MPPRPTKNFYVPPNIKKKPPATSDVSPARSSDQEEKDRREIARREHNRQARLELEDGDQQLETYAEHDQDIEDREEEGRELDEEHHDGAKERRETDDFQVYVGELGRKVTEEDLREAFSPVGDIVAVRLLKYRNKAFSFIRFATVEQASHALCQVPNPLINGKQCRVGPCYKNKTLSVGKTSSHPESRKMVGSRRSSPEKSYASRERDRVRRRSKHSSPEKSYSRRSPASPYGRSYRDAYRGNPTRNPSLAAARRLSHRYDDDDYSYDSHDYRDAYRRYGDDYIDDNHGRDYTSISGFKHSHSAVEEVGPPYAESPTKRSRVRYDCGGSGSRAPYADSSRVEGDHSSAGHSQGRHDTRTSSVGYRRDEMGRGDEERMRRSSYKRDRVPSRGDLRAASSPRDYHSQGNDDSPSREPGSHQ